MWNSLFLYYHSLIIVLFHTNNNNPTTAPPCIHSVCVLKDHTTEIAVDGHSKGPRFALFPQAQFCWPGITGAFFQCKRTVSRSPSPFLQVNFVMFFYLGPSRSCCTRRKSDFRNNLSLLYPCLTCLAQPTRGSRVLAQNKKSLQQQLEATIATCSS